MLRELQERQPLTAESLYVLGMAQLKVGDPTAARTNLKEALSAGLSGTAGEEAGKAVAGITAPE